MIDPLISLSFAIHTNKGVYALLLGSGVSRSAGIPTGWEVVLDLIRQVAALYGDQCDPDPEVWFQKKFEEKPDYSKLLDILGKTASERNQLLKEYFEPTDDERERGLKLPTAAHKAIAQLVTSGHIKVVMTTNFDHLLESALRAVSVNPTVISTPDAAAGAIPLAHNPCTVVKLHGDYLDTRIKNTPDELASYKAPIKRLLDRILDEYGLIVCGWSGQWDTALRAAFERCPNRRYSTYWTTRDEPTEQAKNLIAIRRAEVISISDADTFFRQLGEKIAALEEFARPHPLSKATAIISLKKYLADNGLRIRLHDLVTQEADRVAEAISTKNLPIQVKPDVEPVWTRIQRYEGVCETLAAMMATGCYWSDDQNYEMWPKLLGRIANSVQLQGGSFYQATQLLRLYPALILLYAGGIAAVASKRYNLFRSLLMDVKVRVDSSTETPSGDTLTIWHVLDINVSRRLPGLNTLVPLSDRLRAILQEPLREYLPDETDYDKCFDRFEYLRSLVCFDGNQKMGWMTSRCPGRFYWRRHRHYDVVREIETEFTQHGRKWPPLLAGLFGGDADRFKTAKDVHDQQVDEIHLRHLR